MFGWCLCCDVMESQAKTSGVVVRPAVAADALAVATLMTNVEAGFGAVGKTVGEAEALEYIEGIFDEVAARVVIDAGRLACFVAVQMDAGRKRHYADIFTEQDEARLAVSLQLVIDLAADPHPDWEFWLGINSQDAHIKRLLVEWGFEHLRTYWTLEAATDFAEYPELPPNSRIVRVHSAAEFRDCHSVQQDSFSTHFGFVPRELEDWLRITKDAETFDPNGVFVLEVAGAAVGFVECTDVHSHRGTGYIHGLGVRQAEQGKGYGRLLLHWAMAYCRERGFKSIELNVDTGNESGALRLYDSVGFRSFLSWEQWHRLDWSRLASANLAG